MSPSPTLKNRQTDTFAAEEYLVWGISEGESVLTVDLLWTKQKTEANLAHLQMQF